MADEENLTEYGEGKKSNLIITLEALYSYILTTPEFESLSGKTQVLNVGVSNPELGLTTRMEHDLQVSQNAGKIAKRLGLSEHDIMMAKIGGLAHDLGHMPFGHDGERAIDSSLRSFSENYSFKHERYGAEVLDRIIDRLYKESKEKKVILPEGFNPAYLMLAKQELKRAVKHHTHYYGFQVVNETPAEQCVRLADAISFMVTDLADLLRGYTPDEKGEHIIPIARLQKELNRIPGMNPEKMQIVMPEIEKLVKGEGLEEIQNKLIHEAFSQRREGQKPTTIIDDIKLERDIITALRDIKYNNSRRSTFDLRSKALGSITTYYGYLTEKKNIAEANPEFMHRIEDLVGEKNPAKCYEHLARINGFMKDNTSVELDVDEIRIMHNMLGKDIDGILEVVEKHSNELISRDLSQYPTLMTLFALHDKLQYDLILGRFPERLGNDTITIKAGNTTKEQKIDEAVKTRFERILKFAYAVETDPVKYTLSGKKPNLREYDGRHVPAYKSIISGPVKYALFAVQQMQNSDFSDEKTGLIQVAKELDINPQMLEEILDIPIEEIRFNTPKIGILSKQYHTKPRVIKSPVDNKGRVRYSVQKRELSGVDKFIKYSKEKQDEVLDVITEQADTRLQINNDDAR